MAKSIDEYYSEKMKKLLEKQKAQKTAPSLPPSALPPSGMNAKKSEGRDYYDSFRTKMEDTKKDSHPARHIDGGEKNPFNRTVIDDIREGKPPKKHPKPASNEDKVMVDTAAVKDTEKKRGEAPEKKAEKREAPRRHVAPEQTVEDKRAESERQIEAMQTAKKARTMRNVRDLLVSAGLITAVLVVMCIAAYRLLFVISDINVVGASVHTEEDILNATGVRKGDHLYSFSSREVGELLILRCPEISSVDVVRTPPGNIEFKITEEEPAFYANFYGEYRLLSPTLRILGSVTEEQAREKGCIKLVLPDISNATAGLVPEFADERAKEYIYDVCKAFLSSGLRIRVGTIHLEEKYSITFTLDSKYLVSAGSFESIDTKLKITSAVLKDEMFEKNIKARIDVSDLSETAVVVDEKLKIED